MRLAILLAAAVLAAPGSAVLAHEGHHHLMGTVSAIEAGGLKVKGTDGKTVEVKTTVQTKYVKGPARAAAKAEDLQLGDRVAIDLESAAATPTAAEVRFSTPGPAPSGAPSSKGPRRGPPATIEPKPTPSSSPIGG